MSLVDSPMDFAFEILLVDPTMWSLRYLFLLTLYSFYPPSNCRCWYWLMRLNVAQKKFISILLNLPKLRHLQIMLQGFVSAKRFFWKRWKVMSGTFLPCVLVFVVPAIEKVNSLSVFTVYWIFSFTISFSLWAAVKANNMVLKRVSLYSARAEGGKILIISVLVPHSIWNCILRLGDVNFLPLSLDSLQEGSSPRWKRIHCYGKLILPTCEFLLIDKNTQSGKDQLKNLKQNFQEIEKDQLVASDTN